MRHQRPGVDTRCFRLFGATDGTEEEDQVSDHIVGVIKWWHSATLVPTAHPEGSVVNPSVPGPPR